MPLWRAPCKCNYGGRSSAEHTGIYGPLSQSDESVPEETWPAKPGLADHKIYLYLRPIIIERCWRLSDAVEALTLTIISPPISSPRTLPYSRVLPSTNSGIGSDTPFRLLWASWPLVCILRTPRHNNYCPIRVLGANGPGLVY